MNDLDKNEDLLERNWKIISDALENIVNDMNMHQEKYRLFSSEYYWSAIRISNNHNAFRKTDTKLMEQLHEYSDTMMTYAEQIAGLAQDALQDARRYQCLEHSQMEYFSEQIAVIKNKMDIIQIYNQQYTKELELYAKYVEKVEEILNQDLKTSKFLRAKRFITGK